MAARELGMHPQTLRKYERLGLVQPTRTIGSVRVYSRGEIERLRLIKHLVDELGINLAGVQRLLESRTSSGACSRWWPRRRCRHRRRAGGAWRGNWNS